MDQAQRAVMAQGKRKARLMRSAAVTVFLVSASLSVPVLMQAEAQGYSLSQVSIEGNQRVDAACASGPGQRVLQPA